MPILYSLSFADMVRAKVLPTWSPPYVYVCIQGDMCLFEVFGAMPSRAKLTRVVTIEIYSNICLLRTYAPRDLQVVFINPKLNQYVWPRRIRSCLQDAILAASHVIPRKHYVQCGFSIQGIPVIYRTSTKIRYHVKQGQ